MEYKKLGDKLILRIDKGEEIISSIKEITNKESIKLASLCGIGATNKFTVGVYDPENKEYIANSFEGIYEIVSLIGTINTMDNEVYTHIHMGAADREGHMYGGHLNEAYIGATCEITISIIDGNIDRYKDEETGLNIYKF